MHELTGKVAIVTGGGRGIGAAICKTLAARGAHVVVDYVANREAAEAVVADIAAAGGSARAVRANVLDEADVARLLAETVDAFGRLDIVVLNAAVPFTLTPFSVIEWGDFVAKVDDELRAAFLLAKQAVPVLSEHGCGRLIFVSSETAQLPGSPGTLAHGVAKAALNAFMRYLALELAPRGITANAVSAGLVRTESSASVPEAYLKQVESLIPLGRLGEPEDIASVVGFFAGEDSRFMTGSTTSVVGGQGLGRQPAPGRAAPAE